jgi:hypothetical protein
MIEIHGLTALQRELADKLWGMESMEEVEDFIFSLPRNLRQKAIVVRELLIAATFDEIQDTDLAKQVLANIAK